MNTVLQGEHQRHHNPRSNSGTTHQPCFAGSHGFGENVPLASIFAYLYSNIEEIFWVLQFFSKKTISTNFTL
jgi:hypothetical protein